MLKVQRLAIVWSATIFFLVVSPILAIYALGYDFDLKKNDLKNTVTASVETAPDNAKVQSIGDFGRQNNVTNADFRIPTKNTLKLSISKEGYVNEDFTIKGKSSENSLVRLKKINLLPASEQKYDTIPSEWQNISFVSKEFLLYSKADSLTNQNSWFLQQYSYGGFLGDPKPVSSFVSDTQIQDTQTLPINLDAAALPNISTIPTNSFWEELSADIFWQKETQTYLFKNSSGEWKVWQIQFLNMGQMDTIWLGQNNILLFDRLNSKNLYQYDIKADKLSYLTDNVRAVSFNSNQLWIWYQNDLYRFNKEDLDKISSYDWSGQIKYQLSKFEGINSFSLYQDAKDFKVKNVYQGVVVFINGQIFYLSDSDNEKWVLLANDVEYWTSTWHSIFWVSGDGRLITQNLELGYRRFVAQLDFDITKNKIINLDYYASWHRIFFYISDKTNINSNMQVYSIWYNPDFINNEIKTFSQKKWLDQKICRTFIESGYIFCIDDQNKFISYRNIN
jgi:hypothetical protein